MEQGKDDIAKVYVADMNGSAIEFVESLQAPHPISEKWVVIVSTSAGCPVGCLMCDAGGDFSRLLTSNEIVSQIDFLIKKRFGGYHVPVSKFKVQFARMGEPSFNSEVLDALEMLPSLYDAPGLLPSISSIAPLGTTGFFEALMDIKDRFFRGRFQLQFSMHTTDMEKKMNLIPIKTWSMDEISEFGERFRSESDRKVVLNFAPVEGYPIDPDIIRRHFDPDTFVIKLTPLNPTTRAAKAGLCPMIESPHPEAWSVILDGFRDAGFDPILSIGDLEENKIGSNCGQYIQRGRTEG